MVNSKEIAIFNRNHLFDLLLIKATAPDPKIDDLILSVKTRLDREYIENLI